MTEFEKNELENIGKIEKWKEISKGLYRFVIAANACYEIHLLYWYHDTDILTAKASLFVVGDWNSSDNKSSFFERESILTEQPLFECLEAAQKDYEENLGE